MNVEETRDYCLSKPLAVECLPFDDTALVFKVDGKMFALLDLEFGKSINLKCNPELAVELREQYNDVFPGWHMNKKHWNTVMLESQAGDEAVRSWIDHSYDLVVASLSAKRRQELKL